MLLGGLILPGDGDVRNWSPRFRKKLLEDMIKESYKPDFHNKLSPVATQGCADIVANGDYGKAIAEFNRAIHLKPDYVEAYHARGFAYLIAGNHARAIEDYDEAVRLKTKIALSYMLRGMAYAHLGKKGRAEDDMDKARKLGFQYQPEPFLPEWDGDWSIAR